MRNSMIIAALCAAFFVSGSVAYSDTAPPVAQPPLVLAKDTAKSETAATFALEDFPWDLPEGRTEDVHIPLGDGALTMPWMDVEKSGDDVVLITTPELTIAEEADWGANGGLIFNDAELQIRRLGDAMAISGFAKALMIGDGEAEEVSADLKGFEFALTSRGFELAVEAIKANEESGSEAMIEAMRALNFALDYSVKSSRIAVKDVDEDVPLSALMLSSGPSESSIVFGDGRLSISAEGTDNAFSADGPIPVEGRIGLISYGFAMPVEAANAPQPMQFGIEVSDVSVSEAVWKLADPKGIFPHVLEQAKIDVEMNVILKKSMFDNDGQGPGGESLEPVDVTLKTFEFDGLGLDVSANGDVEMNGEVPKSIAAFLSVAGLSDFMANAVKAGMLLQPQAIMAEGLAIQFGQEEDDGSLTFDVKTEDGMITLNGNRVAPLPQ